MTYPTTEKIGFTIRAVATVIDGILVFIVGSLLSAIVFGGAAALALALSGLAYYTYFWSSYGHGQTLGDRALSIRVVKTDGSELSLIDGLVRYLGLGIGVVCLLIGVIWVAIDAEKQGWHDKIANTYVVKA
jgi:uncharacterized RDD family membrane protein YckC